MKIRFCSLLYSFFGAGEMTQCLRSLALLQNFSFLPAMFYAPQLPLMPDPWNLMPSSGFHGHLNLYVHIPTQGAHIYLNMYKK